jgi:uncharacterized membrane protein YeaQ/YmgE (transglycosylase-associated protein family)
LTLEAIGMSWAAVGALVAIALVCSVVSQSLTGYSYGGFIVNLGVALIGAILGMWLQSSFRLPQGFAFTVDGTVFPLVWASAGAAAAVAALGALWGRKRN